MTSKRGKTISLIWSRHCIGVKFSDATFTNGHPNIPVRKPFPKRCYHVNLLKECQLFRSSTQIFIGVQGQGTEQCMF